MLRATNKVRSARAFRHNRFCSGWPFALVIPLFGLVLYDGIRNQAIAAPAFSGSDDPTIRSSRARGLAVAISHADCGGGSYSVVNSPDGSSVSVLFDNFMAKSSADVAAFVRTQCAVRVPLNLPAGYSMGVFKMDYRGFAHLGISQSATLTVDSGVGRQGRGRSFRRVLKGAHDGDFGFVENIGAGQMRRAGCGAEASLNLLAKLDLRPNGSSQEALVTLDSFDGKERRGVTFHVDLKKCQN